MDISELRRERDAIRKRQQATEIAEMEAKIAVAREQSKKLDEEFVKLAKATYVMTLLYAQLSRHNPRMAVLAWMFAILTKGSLMMVVNKEVTTNVV